MTTGNRVGAWRLAEIESGAFINTPQAREQWPWCRAPCLRIVMWLTLLVCERRVEPNGTALCLLNPTSRGAWSRGLAQSAGLGVAFGIGSLAMALLWRPLPLIASMVVLALLAPCAWSGWKNRAARRRLNSLGPGDHAIYVHSVARLAGPDHRGAGGAVMSKLAAEADARGWVLALDAGAPSLVGYYEGFGFTALGPPVATTWGAAVRMARAPEVVRG